MKNIIFDLGGVCLTDHWGYKQRYSFSEHFHLDALKTEEYHKKYVREINTGLLTEEDYFKGLFLDQRKSIMLSEALYYLYNQNKAYSEVLDFIQSLKITFRLFALTNEIKEAGEFRIKKFKLLDYFEMVYVSGVIGFAKPDKEAYLFVLEKNNLNPKETLFIDNQENNLKTAEEIGMAVVHYIDLDSLKSALSTFNKS